MGRSTPASVKPDAIAVADQGLDLYISGYGLDLADLEDYADPRLARVMAEWAEDVGEDNPDVILGLVAIVAELSVALAEETGDPPNEVLAAVRWTERVQPFIKKAER